MASSSGLSARTIDEPTLDQWHPRGVIAKALKRRLVQLDEGIRVLPVAARGVEPVDEHHLDVGMVDQGAVTVCGHGGKGDEVAQDLLCPAQ